LTGGEHAGRAKEAPDDGGYCMLDGVS
jgi:hypothetical protein